MQPLQSRGVVPPWVGTNIIAITVCSSCAHHAKKAHCIVQHPNICRPVPQLAVVPHIVRHHAKLVRVGTVCLPGCAQLGRGFRKLACLPGEDGRQS